MTLRIERAAISLLALGWSSLALAGDEPLYEPAPDWVTPVEVDSVERDPTNNQVLLDTQVRLQEGLLSEYRDVVLRVSGLSDLAEVGTLTAKWLPDKGDLIVHQITILRDGEAIDLIEEGERFEVLRREQNLEQQILDGSLTATLSVPGMQVGDELRLSYTVTNTDQALGDEVQSQTYLWREPDAFADFSRVMVSWPEDLDVTYKAGPNYDLAAPELRNGHRWLNVALPLPEAKEMPNDAPLRFRRGTILQVGTFADWAEVSSVMAPYYEVDGALDGLDELAEKTDAIRADYDDDLSRAVAALELVQEDIRYLLNGLDGGNYIPQSVATTWEKKYGDCKAKTLILLALLDRLGIDAEAVLVSTDGGNAVPISLPLPGAFNHVLVRANIDGNLYYLDGTSLGANLAIVGNVPAFEYALPVRSAGAQLEPIVQVLPRATEFTMDMEVDATAGGDLPTLGTLRLEFVGAYAAQLASVADKLTDERKKEMASNFDAEMQLLDVEIVSGDDDSEAAMVITGIMPAMFEYDGTRAEFSPIVSTDEVNFSPDRSRRDWRELPVSVGAASAMAINIRTRLPLASEAFELRGEAVLDEEVAGRRYIREVGFRGEELFVTERIVSRGGEIDPAQIRDERRKAASFARNEIKVVAPDDMPRRWRFAQSDNRSPLAALDAAYATMIEKDPEEAAPYLSRASFRYDTYDFAGSLEDMDMVVELEGNAEYYSQRAAVHRQLLDFESARDDLEEAYLLEPSPWRAIAYSAALFDLGDVEGARALLEGEDGDEDVRQSLALNLAGLDAFEGRGEEGLERITEVMMAKPNDANMLNQKCWYMGTWQVRLREALEVCRKAVEVGGTASALDSRALVYFRNGMVAEALADLDAALELAPGQNGSLIMRGLIRRDQGDERGQADIDAALAREPVIVADWRKWGFDL